MILWLLVQFMLKMYRPGSCQNQCLKYTFYFVGSRITSLFIKIHEIPASPFTVLHLISFECFLPVLIQLSPHTPSHTHSLGLLQSSSFWQGSLHSRPARWTSLGRRAEHGSSWPSTERWNKQWHHHIKNNSSRCIVRLLIFIWIARKQATTKWQPIVLKSMIACEVASSSQVTFFF